MAKPKIYDVTATGSTTPRDIRDRLADVVNVKDFGAQGDGITDDTAAIQEALTRGGSIFFPVGEYSVSRLEVPKSVRFIDGNGATILRNTTNTPCINFDDAENLTIKDLVVSCIDATIHGEAFRGRRLKNVSLKGLRCIAKAPYNGVSGDWAFTLSGSCIRMSDIYVESEEVGAWGDGVHLGWVEDFSLTNFDIHAGDDAIAFFQQPLMTGEWVDTPSRNIVVGHGLLASGYSCVKFGCAPREENENTVNHCVRDALFHDIVFHDSQSAINTEDKRTTKAKFTNITFDSCVFDDCDGGRNIGNYGPAVALGTIFFSGCKFRRYKSTDNYALISNTEKLVLENCDFSDTTDGTIDFYISDIESVYMRGCAFSQVGNGIHVVITRVPVTVITSCYFDAQDSYAAVSLVQLPEEGKVIFSNNVVRGTTRSVRVDTPPANLSELLMAGNALTGSNGLSTMNATVKIVS